MPLIGATFVATLVVLGTAQRLLEQTAAAQAIGAPLAPTFEVDPTFPKPLPNNWYQGQSIGLWVDSDDHVWIVHRPDVLDDTEGALDRKTAECCASAPPILEFAPDGYLYVADGRNQKLRIFDRASMTQLTTFGKGGHYPGEWYSLHNIATDSKGNLYTVETYQGRRLQRFLYKGLQPVTSMQQGVAWPTGQ